MVGATMVVNLAITRGKWTIVTFLSFARVCKRTEKKVDVTIAQIEEVD